LATPSATAAPAANAVANKVTASTSRMRGTTEYTDAAVEMNPMTAMTTAMVCGGFCMLVKADAGILARPRPIADAAFRARHLLS
jgi:hypothetical protein